MSADYYTLVTDIGNAKLTNALALGQAVTLTHFAVGDGNGTVYNPVQTQTALAREVYRAPINAIRADADNPTWLTVEAVIPATVGGWTVREAGVFDSDGDLIAIAKYPESVKPALAAGVGKDLYCRLILQHGNVTTVTLKIDPAIVLATRTFVDERLADHVADSDPHPNLTVPMATTEIAGKVELATPQETAAGEDGERAVTPFAIAALLSAAMNGVAYLDAAQAWTKGQRAAPVVIDDADPAIDLERANVYTWTLGANRTLPAPEHLAAGQSGAIWIAQDAAGGRTLAFTTDWHFAGGKVPALSTAAGAVDLLVFETAADGLSVTAALLADSKAGA